MPISPKYRLAKTPRLPKKKLTVEPEPESDTFSLADLPESETTGAPPPPRKSGTSPFRPIAAKITYPVLKPTGGARSIKQPVTPTLHEDLIARLGSIEGIAGVEPIGNSVFVHVPEGGGSQQLTPTQATLLAETEGSHGHDLPPREPSPLMKEPDPGAYGMNANDQGILEENWRKRNKDAKRFRVESAEYARLLSHWKDRAWRRAKTYRPINAATPGQQQTRKFNPVPMGQVFPLEDFGHPGVQSYLNDLSAGDDPNIAQTFATIREGAVPKHDAAFQALDLLHNAMKVQGKTYADSKNITPQLAQRIPPGHMAVEELAPGTNYHVLRIHYPEGKLMQYLGRLNDDDTGYK